MSAFHEIVHSTSFHIIECRYTAGLMLAYSFFKKCVFENKKNLSPIKIKVKKSVWYNHQIVFELEKRFLNYFAMHLLQYQDWRVAVINYQLFHNQLDLRWALSPLNAFLSPKPTWQKQICKACYKWNPTENRSQTEQQVVRAHESMLLKQNMTVCAYDFKLHQPPVDHL